MNLLYDVCSCESGKKFKYCCNELIKKGQFEKINDLSLFYPIESCFATKDWEDCGMAEVVIIRKKDNKTFIAASYLIDAWYLGVKDSYAQKYTLNSLVFYKMTLSMIANMEQISYQDARSIILGGIDFARQINCSPRGEWKEIAFFVEPHLPYVMKFKFGKNGKHVYVPYVEPNDAMMLE